MNNNLFIAEALLLAVFLTACDSSKFSKVENQMPVAEKTPQTSDKSEQAPMTDQVPVIPVAPILISGCRLFIQDKYQVRLMIDDQWQEFSAALPTQDLTNQIIPLGSAADLNAQLTCLNKTCSQSMVQLKKVDPSTRSVVAEAVLHFEQDKLLVVGPEILRDCQEPVFFDYEMNQLIGNQREVLYSLEQLQQTTEVILTFTDLESQQTNALSDTSAGRKASSFRVELSAGDRSLLTVADSGRGDSSFEFVQNERHLHPDGMTYEMTSGEQGHLLQQMTFHFQLTSNPRVQSICYRMPLNPQILAHVL